MWKLKGRFKAGLFGNFGISPKPTQMATNSVLQKLPETAWYVTVSKANKRQCNATRATASLESQMLPPRIYCGCNLISYNETFHPWFSSRSFLSWQKFQIGTTGTLSNLTHLLFHALRDGFRRKKLLFFWILSKWGIGGPCPNFWAPFHKCIFGQ